MPRALCCALLLIAVRSPAQEAGPAALDARRAEAERVTALREAFFDAASEAVEIEDAFESLEGAPLADPTYLTARRGALRLRATARARERLERDDGSLRPWIEAATDAEQTADALEERLLAAVSAGLELAPGFREAAVRAASDALARATRRLQSLSESDPEWPEAAEAARAAAEAQRRLRIYQAAALRRMALPDDTRLESLVLEDLEGTLDSAGADRVERARPLLAEALDSAVELALASRTATGLDTQRDEAAAARERAADEPVSELAELRAASADTREEEVRRHESALEALEALTERQSEIRRQLSEASVLSFLAPERPARLAAASSALVQWIEDARAAMNRTATERTDARARGAEALSDWRVAPEGVDPDEWRRARAELAAALSQRDENFHGELMSIMDALEAGFSLRRRLVPPSLRSASLQSELEAEVRDAPRWLRHDLDSELRALRTVRDSAFELEGLYAFVRVSLDLVLLFLAWVYLRRASRRWLRRGVDAARFRDVSRAGFRGAMRYIPDRELTPIARYGVSAVIALTLHYLLLSRSEALAFVALLWMGWALLRAVPQTARVGFIVSGRALDPFAAVSPSTPELEELTRKTAAGFTWWFVLYVLAAFAAVPLLQADAIRRMVGVVAWLSFAALVIVTLVRWAPWVRGFIRDLADQTPYSEWLGRAPGSFPGKLLRTAGGIVFIVMRIVFWLLVDLGWLTRSGTELVVSQLKLVDAGTELLTDEERERIAAAEPVFVGRDDELERLVKAYESWRKERRHGMVAVIGDHGMGKTAFLEEASAKLATKKAEVVHLEIVRRSRSRPFREQLEWLTKPLGVELPKNATRASIHKAIVEHVESQPARVFLVDDVHLLLRRTVGGLELLQAVMNIVQACSNEHFWVLALHRPAWSYIAGASDTTRLAFRQRIELTGLGADALDEAIASQTRNAGFEPRFDRLLHSSREPGSGENAEAKARSMYWRIIAQASQGNPLAAMDYWLMSLGASEAAANGEPAQVPVYLSASHSEEEIEALSDSDEYLFLLSALVVHDGLAVDDLARVLNVPKTQAQVNCQHLESLHILTHDDAGVLVAPSWQPAVMRVLSRRNFAR